jgi:hypothetical protein
VTADSCVPSGAVAAVLVGPAGCAAEDAVAAAGDVAKLLDVDVDQLTWPGAFGAADGSPAARSVRGLLLDGRRTSMRPVAGRLGVLNDLLPHVQVPLSGFEFDAGESEAMLGRIARRALSRATDAMDECARLVKAEAPGRPRPEPVPANPPVCQRAAMSPAALSCRVVRNQRTGLGLPRAARLLRAGDAVPHRRRTRWRPWPSSSTSAPASNPLEL